LTRDINAHLAKFSNLFVIAPAAGAKFRDSVDCEEIRSELRADYILTGAAVGRRSRGPVEDAAILSPRRPTGRRRAKGLSAASVVPQLGQFVFNSEFFPFQAGHP
jgi:hypothetical protein